MERQIDILASHQVDQQAWNKCIRQSASGLIYATTDYLDHLADNWYGVVINGYESVLPVPFRKKLGIKYCYDVPFMPQLGLFSSRYTEVDEELLKYIFSLVKYGDYNFNFLNQPAKASSIHHNYILSLQDSYTGLSKNFSKDISFYVARSEKQGLIYKEATIEEAMDLFRLLYQKRTPNVSAGICKRFQQLAMLSLKQEKCIVRRIAGEDDKTYAIALLLKDEKRIYNIINGIPQAGREAGANYFLYQELFKEFQQSNLIFDFEGSDIPGVKQFYKKFGAVNQPYKRLHFNHLPLPVRWLKK
jgi:hypothetical protein